MKYIFILFISSLSLLSCSKQQKQHIENPHGKSDVHDSVETEKAKEKQPIKIENVFNVETVKWFKTTGNGTIKGVAKFKSKSGETRFGKQFRIELMPDCLYTQERLHHIYQNNNAGYVYVENGIPTFTPDPKEYHDTKKTMCNEKGEFEFTDLPAGDYYIIAFMLWDKTGGGIMEHVQLKESDTKNIKMLNF